LVRGCYYFNTPGDFLLNISREKSNNSTGAYDDQVEPHDAPKWPAKPILFPIETNVKTTRITGRSVIIRRLKAVNVSSGCTKDLCRFGKFN
jgi:hypothetical protein